MKLYVVNPYNSQKIYLNLIASTRQELANQIGGQNFFLSNNLYNIINVFAENDSNSTITGSFVGGVVGALGGPVGVLVGGLLGGLIGNSSDEVENAKIRRFNNS